MIADRKKITGQSLSKAFSGFRSLSRGFWAFLLVFHGLRSTLIAGSLELSLNAVGPGSVETPCPAPYKDGQGFVVVATPSPGSRFLRWENGSTSVRRYMVLNQETTRFVAHFEAVAPRSFLEEFGLQDLDPTQMPSTSLRIEDGRVRLEFEMTGRHLFRVLRSTNLATAPFEPVTFSRNSIEDPRLESDIGSAGQQMIWVDATDPLHAFYQVEIVGGSSLPALFLAQAPVVTSDQVFHLYGLGFSRGGVAVLTDRGQLPFEVVNDQILRVTAPSISGNISIRVLVEGRPVLGEISVRVESQPPGVTLRPLPPNRTVRGSLLRVLGSGFQNSTRAYVGPMRIPVLAVSADGTSMVVRLPQIPMSGPLTADINGRLIAGGVVRVEESIAGYVPHVSQGFRVSTTDFIPPKRVEYLPYVKEGFRIITRSFERPNSLNYTPFVAQGILVETP